MPWYANRIPATAATARRRSAMAIGARPHRSRAHAGRRPAVPPTTMAAHATTASMSPGISDPRSTRFWTATATSPAHAPAAASDPARGRPAGAARARPRRAPRGPTKVLTRMTHWRITFSGCVYVAMLTLPRNAGNVLSNAPLPVPKRGKAGTIRAESRRSARRGALSVLKSSGATSSDPPTPIMTAAAAGRRGVVNETPTTR